MKKSGTIMIKSVCEGDQKKLFRIMDSLLIRGKSTSLPQYEHSANLVDSFSNYFVGKVETIM